MPREKVKTGDEPQFKRLHRIKVGAPLGQDKIDKEFKMGTEVNPGTPNRKRKMRVWTNG